MTEQLTAIILSAHTGQRVMHIGGITYQAEERIAQAIADLLGIPVIHRECERRWTTWPQGSADRSIKS